MLMHFPLITRGEDYFDYKKRKEKKNYIKSSRGIIRHSTYNEKKRYMDSFINYPSTTFFYWLIITRVL